MKPSLRYLLPCAWLAGEALASLSTAEILPRAGQDADGLDEWLAAAQRVAPEVLKPCPILCSAATDSAGWFLFPDASRLTSCNETMLLNMVVQTATRNDRDTQPAIRACTADYESTMKPVFVPEEGKAALCTTANRVLEKASVRLHQPNAGNTEEFSVDHLVAAWHQVVGHLASQKPSCTNNAIEFAYSQSAAIGLFAGAEIHQHGVTSDVLNKLLEHAQDNAVSRTTVVQLCGADGRGADYSIGVVVASIKNLPFIQETVKTWADGGCVSQSEASEDWMTVTLRVPAPATATDATPGFGNMTTPAQLGARSRLATRADCRTTTVQAGDGCWAVANRCGISQSDLERYNRANLCSTLVVEERVCCSSGTLPSTLPPGNADGTCKTRSVVSGDSCASLASKCGISANDFIKANPKSDLCSTLTIGQPVCCTNGKMPDLKPKPDANGNCATYTTKKDDSCSVIAAARGLTVKNLEDFNKKTWGWNGCKVLYPDFKMCVSTGTPPMPAAVWNAECGPTVNGTRQPPAGTDLATLNPCPLNVCCNTWGQCGTTDDFCVVSKSETGAPGTAAPGENGCISNCGRDIIKGSPPAKKIKIAYYESWNFNRECMNMWVDQIDTSFYTHIHFAFANVTRGDYKVDISDPAVKEQFEIFKGMTGVKRILSFGGWDFSTKRDTFFILREAVLPANRETFKKNIIDFMNEHNLDGVDLDWEYPGAPDIPEIPRDDPVNGLNYYRLLSSIKSAVGSSKSVSFAAPASYWYLKAFPIEKMARDLDYIVYMTYDLHGQWDYDNKWTSPGCDTGNCLRSHVNETETRDALSMITKAGAPSNKVVVGVASYGRSFKMAQAGCDSEDCKFTGSKSVSNAAKGRCTNTAGYISNAEIDEIIYSGRVNKQWKKEGSNFLVYNDTEWVAYMDNDMKKSRSDFYDSYNFAGTSDWAVDLQEFYDGSGGDYYDENETWIDDDYRIHCESRPSSLEQLRARMPKTPVYCVEQYLVDVQVAIFGRSLKKYKNLVNDGYDDKFQVYEKSVRDEIPDQINAFMASKKVDKYFKCKETKSVTCCSDCRYALCSANCVRGDDCKSGLGTFDMDECPKFPRTVGMLDRVHIPKATFTLTDSEGFYKDLAETYGIEREWIKFGKRLVRANNGCQFSGENILECEDKSHNWFRNYPLVNYDKVEIYNPKKIISDSLPDANGMLERFQTVQMYGDWDELMLVSDLLDATSLPAFSTEEAITSMEKIVETANDIIKAQREEFILSFITGLLFWIPFVGSAVGAAGMTTARTLLRLIGSVGEAGLAFHEVIENPDNAFMSVFSYLLGAGVGRAGFRNAAQSRRAMSTREFNSLGDVKSKLEEFDHVRSLSCPL